MEAEVSPSARGSKGGHIAKTAKEVVVGGAGGIAQVLIGQPFDIVKVRMQTQANGSARRVAENIWRREGPLAFYKGSLLPFVGVGASISIVYSSFHGFYHALLSLDPESHGDADRTLSLRQVYLAGGMAGLANSVISGPMEHIRIRLQTQPHEASRQMYRGTRDCAQKILQQAGLTGLYRGQTPTMLREFHSYGIWFAVYEFLLAWVMRMDNKQRNEVASWKVAGCGGLTGQILWAANYPFDVIKSKMQTDGFGTAKRYHNMRHVIQQTWKSEGVHGFFRGLSPTLWRAMPVAAGTFVVVETVRKALD